MDCFTILPMLAGGLVLLVAGGELLVRGASSIAVSFGISPLVIGLTVVAFGTSSPELVVSIRAGLAGNTDVAMGNVVGSNILNVLFVLGACAVVSPLVVSRQLVRREVPIMIAVSVLLVLLALDGRVGFIDGLLLCVGIVVYVGWSIVEGRREAAAAKSPEAGKTIDAVVPHSSLWLLGAVVTLLLSAAAYVSGWMTGVIFGLLGGGAVLFMAGAIFARVGGATAAEVVCDSGFILVGLGALALGAGYLIESATSAARIFGLSDLVIGLTIVAFGTSLPEVATSIVATVRNEREMAIGNVVGSNVFNILGIVGLAAMVTPGGLSVHDAMLTFDMPIMVAVALACLPIFFTGFRIARWEGFLFLASYAAYVAFLILVATNDPALETFTNAMLLVLPVVATTLVLTTLHSMRAGAKG